MHDWIRQALKGYERERETDIVRERGGGVKGRDRETQRERDIQSQREGGSERESDRERNREKERG